MKLRNIAAVVGAVALAIVLFTPVEEMAVAALVALGMRTRGQRNAVARARQGD